MIRLLRHPPRRNEPPFPLDPTDGDSITFIDIIAHPTFREYSLGEAELDGIVSPNEPDRKLRFGVFNSQDGFRKVRAYNGHFIPGVIKPTSGSIPLAQKYAIHGTSLDAAHHIVNDGCD